MNIRNKQILNLALPSIISNITVPLLGLVDLAIVGHLNNIALIGAVAVATTIFNVQYWLLGFLRMGTSGLTAQALGKRDFHEVLKVLLRAFFIATSISLLLIAMQQGVLWGALKMMEPSNSVATFVEVYFNICIWGAPATLGHYVLNGWFVGVQNTKIPMFVAIFQNIVNILASLLFVFVFKMDIAGVALGTLISQWLSFFVSVGLLFLNYSKLRKYLSFNNLWNKEELKRFFNVNRDIFLRTLFLVLVNLFFVARGTRQGDLILSANTLLMTFYTIFSYISDGFAYAGEALSGRYYGAKNIKVFNEIYTSLFKWGIGLALIFTLLYLVLGLPFLSIITNEEQVVLAAKDYMIWAAMIPIVGIAAFVYDGIFIGITETRGMLISSFVAACLFFVVSISTATLLGNHGLWLAMLVFLGMRGLVQGMIMNKKIKTQWK